MADTKLSDLTAASALAGADLFYVAQGGTSKKATVTQVQTATVGGVPTAGQVPVGNAGGTAFAPVSISGDAALASTGALTIANAAVTLDKQANLAANSFQGNNTGLAATPLALTVSQATSLLIGSAAFASLPAAASSTGLIYSVSDAGNALFRSNGTIWKPVGGSAIIASDATGWTAPVNDTNENTLVTVTIPANIMSAFGSLEISTIWTVTNSGNNKVNRIRFSGASGTQYVTRTITAVVSDAPITIIRNRGATNSQVGQAAAGGGTGSSTGVAVTSSVDTTAATTVVITAQKATGTETITLEGYSVRLIVP